MNDNNIKEINKKDKVDGITVRYKVSLVEQSFRNGTECGKMTYRARSFKYCPECGKKIGR